MFTSSTMALPQFLPSPSSSTLTPEYHLLPPYINPNPRSISFAPSSPSRRHHHHKRKPNSPLLLRCSASKNAVEELPLFPLPLVLFPGDILPLKIFEFRYRIMMHTLLHTNLRFGVVYSDATGTANVGCVGEIVEHETLADDRFFLTCKGQERFRVTKLVRSKPYLVADVAWLEDRPGEPDENVEALAAEVETYLKEVITLWYRLNGKGKEAKEVGDLRGNFSPTLFSFSVGCSFEVVPRVQQALLEMDDTTVRLKREREALRNTLNYLTAASAVKDVFPSSSLW